MSSTKYFTGGKSTVTRLDTPHESNTKVDEKRYTVKTTTVGEPGGRYTSTTGPDVAARKAGAWRFSGQPASLTSIRLTIRETTRGSARALFTYDVTREKLKTPYVHEIDGKQIVHEYEFHVKAVAQRKTI